MTARYVLPALLLSVSITGALTAKDARSTIFLGLRPVNCPETTARDIGDKIRGRLDRLTYCDLITEKKSERAMRTGGIKSPCTDRQCSVAIARILKSERAVYGTVGITTVTFDQRMGKDGAGKYLLREKEVRKYVIALTLLDADKNTVIAAVTDNAEDATLDRDIGRIVARLQLFFAPLKPLKEGTAQAAGREPAVFYACLHPSGFMPLGSFRSMALGGAGIIAGAGVSNLALNNSEMRVLAGYYYVFTGKNKIESYHAVPLSLQLGYTFTLPKGFSLTPLVGGGYVMHLLSEDAGLIRIPGLYRFSPQRYYDPHCTAVCEAGYRIDAGWAIVAAAGYTAFFEKSNIGMFISADIGFKYNF